MLLENGNTNSTVLQNVPLQPFINHNVIPESPQAMQNPRAENVTNKSSDIRANAPSTLDMLKIQVKSLSDENRALQEKESALKEQIDYLIIENEQNKVQKIIEKVSPKHLVRKEKLLYSIDQKIQKINNVMQQDLSNQTNRHLEYLVSCATRIRHAVNQVGLTLEIEQVLETCELLFDIISSHSSVKFDDLEEFQLLDARVNRLYQEKDHIQQESDKNVDELKSSHKSEILQLKEHIKSQNDQISQLEIKVSKLTAENQALSHKAQELLKANENLTIVANVPPLPPKVMAIPEYLGNEILNRDIEELKLVNAKIVSHSKSMESTIEEWKNENSDLQDKLSEKCKTVSKYEKEIASLQKKLAETERIVNIHKTEIAKNQIIMETLQTEYSAGDPYETREMNLEDTVKAEIEASKSRIKSLDASYKVSDKGNTSEEYFLKLIQNTDESSEKIDKLKSMILGFFS